MIIAEIPFGVFLQRNPHIKNMSLNEQYAHYNDYLMVNQMQMDFIRGKSDTQEETPVVSTDFLLQENGDYLLQEDGSKIYL